MMATEVIGRHGVDSGLVAGSGEEDEAFQLQLEALAAEFVSLVQLDQMGAQPLGHTTIEKSPAHPAAARMVSGEIRSDTSSGPEGPNVSEVLRHDLVSVAARGLRHAPISHCMLRD